MKPNIWYPRLASMFTPDWLVMTVLKMVNITVAMMAAAAVRRAEIKVNIDKASDHQRE
jgi:hypothetical protein